jgi:hypothetical protein
MLSYLYGVLLVELPLNSLFGWSWTIPSMTCGSRCSTFAAGCDRKSATTALGY